jgi:hypothetical protein
LFPQEQRQGLRLEQASLLLELLPVLAPESVPYLRAGASQRQVLEPQRQVSALSQRKQELLRVPPPRVFVWRQLVRVQALLPLEWESALRPLMVQVPPSASPLESALPPPEASLVRLPVAQLGPL